MSNPNQSEYEFDTFNVGDYAQAPVTEVAFKEADVARAVAVIDGIRYPLVSYTYHENCHGATDTASVVMTASSTPDWTAAFYRDTSVQTGQPGLNTTILINIYAGFPSNPSSDATDISQLQLQFAGSIDQYTIKMLLDEVSFDCRSLGAPLTTNKVTTPLSNQTTTQFIAQQAERFGLSVNIPVESTNTMQTILRDELIAGIRNIVIWDLILRCAIWDDCDVWVDSLGVLNYVAPYNIANRQKLDIMYGRDLIDLEVVHSPQFSKDIQVEVRSATLVTKTGNVRRVTQNIDGSQSSTQYQKTSINEPIYGSAETINTQYTTVGGKTTISISDTTKTGGPSNSGNTAFEDESKKEKYIFVRKGLTQQQCVELSNKIWRQISQHEYSVTMTLPVTKAKLPNLGITSIVRLHGTPYTKVNSSNQGFQQSFSQTSDYNFSEQQGYWPRSIEWSFSATAGWLVKMVAINHTPPSGAV